MADQRAKQLQESWELDNRWKGIQRPYTAEDVIRLRGSIDVEHTLARKGSEKLWKLLNEESYINARCQPLRTYVS
jgi:isocitrate lyase